MSNATTQIDTQARSHPSRDPRPLPVAIETRWPPPQGQWTYQDWLRLPDDGWQYEIIPGQETPVQPDLLFVTAERAGMISERGVEGAPDLVVEILSPRTWWRDRRIKMPLYEETGVRECWIVNLDAHTSRDPRPIEVYVLREQTYALLGQWGAGEAARSEVLERFEIEVDAILPSRA